MLFNILTQILSFKGTVAGALVITIEQVNLVVFLTFYQIKPIHADAHFVLHKLQEIGKLLSLNVQIVYRRFEWILECNFLHYFDISFALERGADRRLRIRWLDDEIKMFSNSIYFDELFEMILNVILKDDCVLFEILIFWHLQDLYNCGHILDYK